MANPILIRGVWTFKKRVPADVLRLMPGPSHVKRSLQTRNIAEARARYPAMAAQFEEHWAQVRLGVQSLTPLQCDALSGEICAKLIKRGGDGIGGRRGKLGWTISRDGCKAALQPYVDDLMASTFFVLNDLVGCGHMSGL
jgi:hypothetical protein